MPYPRDGGPIQVRDHGLTVRRVVANVKHALYRCHRPRASYTLVLLGIHTHAVEDILGGHPSLNPTDTTRHDPIRTFPQRLPRRSESR
jgi:hypothetical protein